MVKITTSSRIYTEKAYINSNFEEQWQSWQKIFPGKCSCIQCVLVLVVDSVSDGVPSAIGFYDRVGFTQLQVIPDYYYISFRHAAAVLCCSYVNGGQPFPHTFSSYFQRYVMESWCCRLVSELGQWLVKWARGEDLEQTGSVD